MNEWQLRVIEETNELTARLVKLTAFLGTPAGAKLGETDRALLWDQHYHMAAYLKALIDRQASWEAMSL